MKTNASPQQKLIGGLRCVAIEPEMFDLEHCELNVEKLVDVVAGANANALRIGFFGHTGLAYYPSKIAPPRPGLNGRDLLAEFQAACGKRGIELIVYLNCSFDISMYRKHPEWAVQLKGKDAVDDKAPYARISLNTPYLDYVMSIHREVVERYRPNVVYFDTFKVHAFCTNPFTRRLVKEQAGIEIPEQADWDSPQWLKYLEWREKRSLELAGALVGNVKSINPDAVVIFNRESFRNQISSTPEENKLLAKEVADHIHAEAAVRLINEEYWHVNQQCYYGQSMDLLLWLWVEHGNGRWLYSSVTSHEIKLKIAKVLANGARPNIWCIPWAPAGDQSALSGVRLMYGMVKENPAVFDHTSTIADTAIIASTGSRRFYTRGLEPFEFPYEESGKLRRFQEEMDGFTKLALYGHQLLTYRLDEHLTEQALRDLRLLVLPNVGAMSDAAVEAVRRFVRDGGALMASYETSLFDEKGKRRPDFGLADVFGCSWQSEAPSLGNLATLWEHPGYVQVSCNEIGLSQDKLIPAAGNAAKISPTAAASLGRLAYGGSYILDHRQSATELHGLLCNAYGKGRVVYWSFEVGFAYLAQEPNPILETFKTLANWLVGGKPTIATNLPGVVEISLRRTAAGDVVVHVIPTPGRKPYPDGPLVAHNVRLRLELDQLRFHPAAVTNLTNHSSGFGYSIREGVLDLCWDIISEYEVILIRRGIK